MYLIIFMTGSETGVPVGHIANFVAGFCLSCQHIMYIIDSKLEKV